MLQEEYATMGLNALKEDLLTRSTPINLNVEYRVTGMPYATLVDPESKDDLGKTLIADGLLMVEKKGGRRLAKLVNSYIEAMEKAKKSHLNIWEYGDITADDAREFGAGR